MFRHIRTSHSGRVKNILPYKDSKPLPPAASLVIILAPNPVLHLIASFHL